MFKAFKKDLQMSFSKRILTVSKRLNAFGRISKGIPEKRIPSTISNQCLFSLPVVLNRPFSTVSPEKSSGEVILFVLMFYIVV